MNKILKIPKTKTVQNMQKKKIKNSKLNRILACLVQRSALACAFPGKGKRRGSLTVEASVVFPLFMMVLIALFMFFAAGTAESKLTAAMEAVGERLSYYYFAVEEFSDAVSKEDMENASGAASESNGAVGKENAFEAASSGNSEAKGSGILEAIGKNRLTKDALSAAVGSVIWYPVSETIVRGMVEWELQGEWASELLVDDGYGGITFFGTRYDKANESIVLSASYNLKVPFADVLDISIPISVRTEHRVWSGKPFGGETEEKEQIVYVTETGKVYHLTLNCKHLNLSIRKEKISKVPSLRNESGGKYYPCEKCGNGSGIEVYVTNYGDRYHFSRNCSGLKRTIQSIPISEVGDRPLCKSCAEKQKK